MLCAGAAGVHTLCGGGDGLYADRVLVVLKSIRHVLKQLIMAAADHAGHA
jgi:hypothetical protein